MQEDHEHEHGLKLAEVLRVVFVALAAAAVWFHLWEPFHRVSVIGLAATLIGGYPIFKEAFENIVERRMTMELSMTIALVSALAIGEFFTALVITAFVLAAEILEGLTVGRGRRAIQDMLDFLPQTASVLRERPDLRSTDADDHPWRDRPHSTRQPDSRRRPGVSGHSFVEQAAITGEPMPSEKTAGSEVYAGTINQAGTFRSAPTVWEKKRPSARSLKRSSARNIRARPSRRPRTGLLDTLSTSHLARQCSHFSSRTTFGPRSRSSSLLERAVLPPGTPLAISGSDWTRGAQGSIIKGGIYLEALGQLDTVFLDKTGTLTYGFPSCRRSAQHQVFRSRRFSKPRRARSGTRSIPLAAPSSALRSSRIFQCRQSGVILNTGLVVESSRLFTVTRS